MNICAARLGTEILDLKSVHIKFMTEKPRSAAAELIGIRLIKPLRILFFKVSFNVRGLSTNSRNAPISPVILMEKCGRCQAEFLRPQAKALRHLLATL